MSWSKSGCSHRMPCLDWMVRIHARQPFDALRLLMASVPVVVWKWRREASSGLPPHRCGELLDTIIELSLGDHERGRQRQHVVPSASSERDHTALQQRPDTLPAIA